MHSHATQTHRILGLITIMFLMLWAVPSKSQGTFILNADDTQAKKWMELQPDIRSSFVLGFLAGLDYVYNSTGLTVTLNRALSAKELSAHVYKSLLDQPELRAGPIDEIILNALDHVLTITDKSGIQVNPGLKEVDLTTR